MTLVTRIPVCTATTQVRRGRYAVAALGCWLYERSLLIAFSVLFVGSFVGHAIAGAREYSAEQHEHGAAGIDAWQFVRTSEFWFQSFQNWQSEFLAVGAAIVVLSIFLRQRGSPESKGRPRATRKDRRLTTA